MTVAEYLTIVVLFLIGVLCTTQRLPIKQGFKWVNSRLAGHRGEGTVRIGLLSQPINESKYAEGNYIVTSYAQYVRAAGAEAVLIQWDWPVDKIKDVFAQINGLLLPGGDMNHFDQSGSPTEFVKKEYLLLDLAMKANQAGEHFPVWGTCQGFEHMMMYFAKSTKILQSGFDSQKWSQNIQLTIQGLNSRMMKGLSTHLRSYLQTKPSVFLWHEWGVTPAHYHKFVDATKILKVLATGKDKQGREFIAAFEHNVYPMYGVQFHPEVSLFPFGHSAIQSLEIQQIHRHFATMLISESRKNNRTFKNQAVLRDILLNENVPVQMLDEFFECYILKPSS